MSVQHPSVIMGAKHYATNKASPFNVDSGDVNILTFARPTIRLLWLLKGSPARPQSRHGGEKKAACVTLRGALARIIFCCCLEVLTFHGESNFKKDEGVIPDNTGIISLNDLYLAMRHGVLFNSTIPSLV